MIIKEFDRKKAHLLLTIFGGIFVMFALLAPITAKIGLESLSLFFYSIFSPICHQNAQSSYHLFGKTFGCCSRCIGIYSGLLVYGLVMLRYNKIKLTYPKVLLLFAPMIFGRTLAVSGLYRENNFSKSITGFLFGAGILCIISSCRNR